MAAEQQGVQPEGQPDGRSDGTSVRGILYTAAGLVAMLLVCGTAIGLLMHYYPLIYQRRQPPLTEVEQQRQPPPRPRLEVNSPAQGAEVIEAGQAKLRGYGQVPGQSGLAHIPIERAMQILSERGWPAPGQGAAP